MLIQINKLPSLTSEIPFSNNIASDPESRPQSSPDAPNTASQAPSATGLPQAIPLSASRSPAMAAQYYAKRVEELPKPTGMILPALAAAIAPGQVHDTRYRSPYSAPEPPRPPHALASIVPMAPMTMASGSNTPDPGATRLFPNLNEANRMLNRTSSESQTDEHHDLPQPVTMPGNNQYTPGVQRVSHPGTPQPTTGDGSKPSRPRPHVCLTCQRTFARREHLNRHELSHTKEKPFECNECSRCFSRRDLLLRHKQKLHITNPYVRPRDRVKGDGPSDGDSPMAPMAQMSGNDGTTGVSIAIHPSGQIQRNHGTGEGSGSSAQHGGDREVPSSMVMPHMLPAVPLPRANPGQQSQQPPPAQPQPSGSAASLYYQKQDIDVSKIDLSRFRSLGRSSHSPRPTGPPTPQQPGHYQGPYHAPPQGAPVPVSPHAQHRHVEVPRPPVDPISHDPEESSFHIPFAKRPRRGTDGRSRAPQQTGHEQGQQSHFEPRKPAAFPHFMPLPGQHEPPHSLLDQLAIAAVPGERPSYRDRHELMPQAPMGMSYSQPPHQPEQEVWRSPGGTHRVVQFDHSSHPSHAHPAQAPQSSSMDTSSSGLAPPSHDMQARSPSQGRKRSLQDEDKEEEEGMKMQGGFRRSMRRALSMSMEDSQRPVALLKALEDADVKETAEMMAKESATPERGRANVRYVKPQISKSSLKNKKVEKADQVEKKAASPVRGRKPPVRTTAVKDSKAEEVTPEKRGRGRPPKATPASSYAKGNKSAKTTKPTEESEEDENEEEEQAAIEEQLAQEEKRTRNAIKETKKASAAETKSKKKDEKKEEGAPGGRTFRSVRLQARYIDKK